MMCADRRASRAPWSRSRKPSGYQTRTATPRRSRVRATSNSPASHAKSRTSGAEKVRSSRPSPPSVTSTSVPVVGVSIHRGTVSETVQSATSEKKDSPNAKGGSRCHPSSSSWTARIGSALPRRAVRACHPIRSFVEGRSIARSKPIVPLAPGASGTSSVTGSAVHPRERSPAAPPLIPDTTIVRSPQPPDAFAHSRSHTTSSGAVPMFSNVIDAAPSHARPREDAVRS